MKIDKDANVTLFDVDPLIANCFATGHPPPSLVWLNTAGEMMSNDSILNIPSHKLGLNYSYTCKACHILKDTETERTERYCVNTSLSVNVKGKICCKK